MAEREDSQTAEVRVAEGIPDAAAPPQTGAEADTSPPFWIGIGASAGGLEAIRELVQHLSLDLPATFIVLQHMAPQHKSLLATLIGRETSLPTFEITADTMPQRNTIYVAPPNRDVVVENGRLVLQPPSVELASPKPSIDRFFVSMAAQCGARAVAIVLSGTGSDGAYGVQAVRAAGGITIAQDDSSAKYDGMPVAAIETGCIDLVLHPAQIGSHLGRVLASPRNLTELRGPETESGGVADLLQILLARTRVDFRDYKQTTVMRRIERRMAALGFYDLQDYVRHVRSHPREVDALFKDLLISVTRFFRDPAEFDALRPFVQDIVDDHAGGTPIRVWVAGSATGEEAYSIAMLFAEAMGGPEVFDPASLQVFATDIDRAALKIARAGVYSAAALDDVPQALAESYFRHREDTHAVIGKIKDAILFSEHNVFQDPPFLNIDLCCCRNLLIYFNPQLQARVLARFEYALRPNGLLFLGTAEAVAGQDAPFRAVTEGARIYRKRAPSDLSVRRVRDFSLAPTRQPRALSPTQTRETRENRAMFEALVRSVGPDALLVSTDFRILEVFGDMTRFLALRATSRPQMTIAVLRDPYLHDSRTLAMLAQRNQTARYGVRRTDPDQPGKITQVVAFPIGVPGDDMEPMTLLVYREWEEDPPDSRPATDHPADSAREIDALQREVQTTREALQQTVEELETSNEELQALNEELQSTNEELQATNEELETANEELQSTNEELITVNEEQQINATELVVLTEELDAILKSIPTPVIVVDSSLHVTRASSVAQEHFHIRLVSDRPHVSQLHVQEGCPPLAELLSTILQLGKSTDNRFVSLGQTWLVRCAPFSDARGRIIGASAVFTPVRD